MEIDERKDLKRAKAVTCQTYGHKLRLMIQMVKYRGKHEGKTRGAYVRDTFRSEQARAEETLKNSRELHSVLTGLGFCTGMIEADWGYKKIEHSSYHVAGATIGMETIRTIDYQEALRRRIGALPHNYIQLTFVSNDSLDDICEKVSSKYPFFKNFERIDPSEL